MKISDRMKKEGPVSGTGRLSQRNLHYMVILFIAMVCFACDSSIQSRISAYPNQQLPPVAANFTLPSLAGENISLNQYKGKYLLINFWATWCGPCKKEMPSLEALYQRFKSENFDILAISNEKIEAGAVEFYVTGRDLSFTVLLDEQLKVSRQYGVTSLPTTFLIDPQGNIIGAMSGAENWAEPSTLQYFENLINKKS